MKKLIPLLLTLVMCLSLCACDGKDISAAAPDAAGDAPQEPAIDPEKPLSKEEMLAVAEKYSMSDIQNDLMYIGSGFEDKFLDKTLLLSGWVEDIGEDHIKLFDVYGFNTYMMDVYLPADELALLQKGQYITVVGNTTDEITDMEVSVAGQPTRTYFYYQMPDAYFVEEGRVEVTGTLRNRNFEFFPAFDIVIDDHWELVYFADSVDTTQLKSYQEIRFSAKRIKSGYDVLGYYYDAEILE